MSIKITENFLDEALCLALKDKTIFEIMKQYLKFSFLPSEEYKKIWKYFVNYHNIEQKVPTYGIASQAFASDVKSLDITELLAKIKLTTPPEKDKFIQMFELYIKQCLFLEGYDQLGDIYNKSHDKEDVVTRLGSLFEEIQSVSLRESTFHSVFAGFSDRYADRMFQIAKSEMNYEKNTHIPFGIDPLDFYTKGGFKLGDTVLFLGQSGYGKSQVLKYMAVQSALRGLRVAHFQLEDTLQLCLDQYDQVWTGSMLEDIERCQIEDLKFTKLCSSSSMFQGEIIIDCFEQFGTPSALDIDRRLTEMEKIYGKIHLVIIDYLELCNPGDGKKYRPQDERFRREAVGNKFKNIAVKHYCGLATATQASSVSPAELNNPGFFMDRYNVSECKGIVKPFSYFITINATRDELQNGFARLYCDKFRKHKAGQLIPIVTGFDRGRFYNKKMTLKYFWDADTCEIKKEAETMISPLRMEKKTTRGKKNIVPMEVEVRTEGEEKKHE
jgi:hypothetical protein